MLSLSLRTFRDRWQLFIGAALSIAIGVALVQSSLQLIAAAQDPPTASGLSAPEQARLVEGYDAAGSVMGMTMFLAGFLAVFIVGSTFAFTVAERRRDLALLRLVGGSARQVARLLLAESVVLGLLGGLAGLPLGAVLTVLQSRLLVRLGLPDLSQAPWRAWTAVAALVVGMLVAALGARGSARRGGRVEPLEALVDIGASARVMTRGRWISGLLLLACFVVLLALSTRTALVGAALIALNLAVFGALAFTRLAPLVVPGTAAVLGRMARSSPVVELALANVVDGVRRSASAAAPLIVLAAVVVTLATTLGTLSRAVGEDLLRSTRGQLVLTTTGDASAQVAAVAGIAAFSSESEVPVTVTVTTREFGPKTYASGVYAVDPTAYGRIHRVPPRAGSLSELTGQTLAVGPGATLSELRPGPTYQATVDGRAVALRSVAVFGGSVNSGTNLLVPRSLVPAAQLARAPTRTVVLLRPGASSASVATALRRLGTVQSLPDWVRRSTAEQDEANVQLLRVLLGLSGLYALIAVVNATVIGGSQRTVEFARARLTGLTRRQVVCVTLVETGTVVLIGLGLGLLEAAAGAAALAAGTRRLLGQVVLVVPWPLIAAVCGAGAVTALGACLLTTLAATRRPPVLLASCRE